MSFATDMLTQVESVLTDRLSADVQEYQHNGRRLVLMPVSELLELRDYFKAEASKEAAAASTGNPNRVKFRF